MTAEELREILARNPNSVEIAWRVWNSLGNVDGCDVRNQGDVQRCFYILAYENGAIGEYLKAAKELNDKSSELITLPTCFKKKAAEYRDQIVGDDDMRLFIDSVLGKDSTQRMA